MDNEKIMSVEERLANRDAMENLWTKINAIEADLRSYKAIRSKNPNNPKTDAHIKWLEEKLDRVESAYEYTCKWEQAMVDAEHEEALRHAAENEAKSLRKRLELKPETNSRN